VGVSDDAEFWSEDKADTSTEEDGLVEVEGTVVEDVTAEEEDKEEEEEEDKEEALKVGEFERGRTEEGDGEGDEDARLLRRARVQQL